MRTTSAKGRPRLGRPLGRAAQAGYHRSTPRRRAKFLTKNGSLLSKTLANAYALCAALMRRRPRSLDRGRASGERLAKRGAFLLVAACLGPCDAAQAEALRKTGDNGAARRIHTAPRRAVDVPEPPKRPAVPAASDETPAARPSGGAPPPAPLDMSVPPPMLPRATRKAMHDCALEWEKVKRESRPGAPAWRDFAVKCLTR